MARIFLDANYFIDLLEERTDVDLNQHLDHQLFVSPLSVHILFYLYKYKIPNTKIINFIHYFSFIAFDEDIVSKSLDGPTSDFEDNVQLHSAAEVNCDIFLTRDQGLLERKFFGKAKMMEHL